MEKPSKLTQAGPDMDELTATPPRHRIRFNRITDNIPLSLRCPHCGEPRMQLSANASAVPGGGYWLTDGDTIPGLLETLIQTGKETERPRDVECNFDYELLVGDCPRCGEDYFVVQASFIDAEVDSEWVHVYFHQNGDLGLETNFRASLPGGGVGEWAMQQFDTPKGLMQHHLFGPFAMSGDIRGPNGVSACCGQGGHETWDFGRNLLLGLWDELKLANQRRQTNHD